MDKTAVILGFFDGLHRGHMSLVNKAVSLKSRGLCAAAFIFDRHPAQVFGREIRLIMDANQKKDALIAAGIDEVYIQKLDRNFLNLTPHDFVRRIISEKLNAACVIVGENYTFGKNKSGNVRTLRDECAAFGAEVFCMPYVRADGNIISSTYIRNLIENGDIEKANSLTAAAYTIPGKVVFGRQDGRKMGFPTANIIPESYRVLPPNGVYSTRVHIDGACYPSVTNVGFAPTFGGSVKTVETNIPGFNENIYDRRISVEFLRALRFEKKFSSVAELKEQIGKDVKRRMDDEKRY